MALGVVSHIGILGGTHIQSIVALTQPQTHPSCWNRLLESSGRTDRLFVSPSCRSLPLSLQPAWPSLVGFHTACPFGCFCLCPWDSLLISAGWPVFHVTVILCWFTPLCWWNMSSCEKGTQEIGFFFEAFGYLKMSLFSPFPLIDSWAWCIVIG